jgi:C_GCAxxG_C_C family probable redox protein
MHDDSDHRPPSDAAAEGIALARDAFLDDANRYGCAEAAFVALKAVLVLPDPVDTSAAMPFNGGLAWTGGPCGAVTGAALAIGILAGQRIPDHHRAKVVSRELVASLVDDFTERYGSLDCRDLVGTDLRAPGAHAAFIASGAWRRSCMNQIEFAVAATARLADPVAWAEAVAAAEDAAVRRDAG